ncbi:MAG: DUF6017 domain-containing protein [Paludibacter sp.]|nr:DUF6017 domain-containing protein [Paludibacter sp.]
MRVVKTWTSLVKKKGGKKMSKILFDEQPLIVSRELAKLIGLNEAIVLQQIHYWLEINRKANKNFHDGCYWTYNSIKNWHENDFSFWCFDTVKRTFTSLLKKGFLISSNYNRQNFDQTKWYTIDYKALEMLNLPISAKCTNGAEPLISAISANCTNGEGQFAPMEKGNLHQPIPENNTEINPSCDKSCQSSRSSHISKTSTELKDGQDRTKQTIENYTALIKKNITYNDFALAHPRDVRLIDEIIGIMIDALLSRNDTIRIDQEEKSLELVKSVLLKLNYNNVEHVLTQFKNIENHISKKKQYILTMLYNCKLEMNSHYTNAVASN